MTQIDSYIQELHTKIKILHQKIHETQDKSREQDLAFELKKTQIAKKAQTSTTKYEGKGIEFNYSQFEALKPAKLSTQDLTNHLNQIFKIK